MVYVWILLVKNDSAEHNKFVYFGDQKENWKDE